MPLIEHVRLLEGIRYITSCMTIYMLYIQIFKMINDDFVRPIHFVSDITDGRLSIGLRQNTEL